MLLTSELHSNCIYLGLGKFSSFLGRKWTKPYDISGRSHNFTQKLSYANFPYCFPWWIHCLQGKFTSPTAILLNASESWVPNPEAFVSPELS
jgi:hypothetical protein